MKDYIVPNRDPVSDLTTELSERAVQGAAVLNVGFATDFYGHDITPESAVKPDRRALAQMNIANNPGAVSDENVFFNFGRKAAGG
jgi:hypothetical protein